LEKRLAKQSATTIRSPTCRNRQINSKAIWPPRLLRVHFSIGMHTPQFVQYLLDIFIRSQFRIRCKVNNLIGCKNQNKRDKGNNESHSCVDQHIAQCIIKSQQE
jgi:hypothetical protein